MESAKEKQVTIDFQLAWKKENDVKPCSMCQDLIVSGSNNAYVQVVGTDKIYPMKFIICNSCFDLFNTL